MSHSFAGAQDPDQPQKSKFEDPADRLLRDFASAASTFDVKRMEGLFLPPDSSPDGKNRQGHLEEMRKDWKRARDGQEKMAIAFKNTVTTVRTEMLLNPAGADARPIPVELKVVLTRDGYRIAAMETGKSK